MVISWKYIIKITLEFQIREAIQQMSIDVLYNSVYNIVDHMWGSLSTCCSELTLRELSRSTTILFFLLF